MSFTPPDPIPAAAPTGGPCQPWTDINTVRDRCASSPEDLPNPALTYGIELASLVLWDATARQYGLCQRTIRPCWEGDHNNGFGATGQPAHRWWSDNLHPSMHTSTGLYRDLRANGVCGCRVEQLRLPGPIAWVTEVMVDGVALDPTSLAIRTTGHRARKVILRVDGEFWPCCNNLIEDPTEVPTEPRNCPAWQVTYVQGQPVPYLGQEAAAVLAEQFARQVCGASGCDPNMTANLTRVARRGVTKEYDPKKLRDPKTGRLRTGLYAVDEWVDAVNPHGRHRTPAIIRPDDPERRRLWSWVDAIPA